ncbi:MAG: DNA repair protein RecN [Arcanobacterium sp.]|nr:DNA repair protein RecN [Arcanobacterium sp.]
MIEEISIQNLGVIAQSELSFNDGMTAITGETGSGKTMALTSLLLLMGAKADSGKIRNGADRAVIEGVFSVSKDSAVLPLVEACGGQYDVAGDRAEILIARHLLTSGRSRAYVGGASVPVTLLKDLAGHLFTVHGQSDQVRLTAKNEQRQHLDEYAQLLQSAAWINYQETWRDYQSLQNKLKDVKNSAKDRGAERLAIEGMIRKIDEVSPILGEDDALLEEARKLDNVEGTRQVISQVLLALEGDGDSGIIADSIAAAITSLERSNDELLQKFIEPLQDAANLITEVGQELSAQLHELQADPQRLDEIYARRALLKELVNTLVMDIPEILVWRETAEERLAEVSDPAAYIAQLEIELKDVAQTLQKYGEEISQLRKLAAAELSAAITNELKLLEMADAEFEIVVTDSEIPTVNGLDEIDFLLRPHRGANFEKLGMGASGGEISRVMLAIEVSLAEKFAMPDHTFIFDEVDSGIGGKTALQIGKRLSQLAQSSQIIAVTHLAQVAAAADAQLHVEKMTVSDATVTELKLLIGEDRERELARMLSGHENSEAARTHAAELLTTFSE